MISRLFLIFSLVMALPCLASDKPLLDSSSDNPNWNAGNVPELQTYDTKIVLRQGQDVEEIKRAFTRLGKKILEPVGFYVVDQKNNPQEWGKFSALSIAPAVQAIAKLHC